MSSTYTEVKTYNDKSSYARRKQHNSRKSNLSTGKYKDDKYLNIVEKFEVKEIEKVSKRSRTQITNEISRLRDRMKKAKKDSTKEKLFEKILKLELERSGTDNKTSQSKKNYIELTFVITDIPKYLKRNTDYAEDLKNLILEYVKEKFPNLDMELIALHLDQSNPHVHINGIYQKDNSLTKDLRSSFKDDKFQYSIMQKDFNNFVMNSNLIKKHNINVEKVIKGGKKDYMKLHSYKAREARAYQRAKDITEKYVKQIVENNKKLVGYDTNKIISTLQKKIIKLEAKRLSSHFKTSEIYKIIEDNATLVNKHNNNVEKLKEAKKALHTQANEIKSQKDTIQLRDKTIDSLKGDKQDLQQEINRLKAKYEPEHHHSIKHRR